MLRLCAWTPEGANLFNTRRTKKAQRSSKSQKKKLAHGSTGLRHDVDPLRLLHLRCYCNISNAAATTTLPVVAWDASGLSAAIWAEMIHLCSCVLQQKLFFGHDTFGENHLYLAPNQARRVISAGRHWAAAISCPLISLKGGLGQYTLRNRANNALVVLHKGSHKLWHGVKTPAANLVLSAVLLPSIRVDLPGHPPLNRGPQSRHLQAEVAHAVAGSLPLTAVPTNSDSFPLRHGDRRTQEVISSHCHLSDWAGHDLKGTICLSLSVDSWEGLPCTAARRYDWWRFNPRPTFEQSRSCLVICQGLL